MDDAIRQRIEARIEQLKREREQFVMKANLQLGGYNGAIDELEMLLRPQTPQPAPDA